jgi:hypothetical protein
MLACVCATAMATPAYAANWVMLQGVERPNAVGTAEVWGFLQPQYSETDGTRLAAGPWAGQNAVFNTIAPDLKAESQFHLQRARIGARGQNFPLNSKINYFFLAEFGDNGITSGVGGAARVTDASITLNYIPGARIRVGQFKYPGSEEGLQAIHVFDYINFTNVTDSLLLERFFNRTGEPACATISSVATAANCANSPNGSVGAFRDVGIQVFNAFRTGDWEHTYAVMVGNGNGIARGDNNDAKDIYTYLSTEWVFGGEGPRREGMKFFIWNQDGERTIIAGGTDTQADGTMADYDRTRTGGGISLRKGKYRFVAEYVKADGMIFDGTDGGAVPGSLNNARNQYAGFNIAPVDKAKGWYADVGYLVLPNLELDLRYDTLDRRTETAVAEREFTTTTVGLQYFFDRRNRLAVNYEFREAEAPNLPSTNPANQILEGMDDRLSLQLTSIF